MKISEVRQKYLDFFKNKGHAVIPSSSLVPENDPTTLFTGSGMQSLIPYLLGENHPAGSRLTNSQKCFRAVDINEVGDSRHTTFFEMLGNWSLGSYWKDEQLAWLFEFLTKEISINKDRLWVTCFEGEKNFNLPQDTESAKIWEQLGIRKERILFYSVEKNWWSRSGEPQNMPTGEPGGPDSEVFYCFENVLHNKKFGERCHPNCDCGRFMEIGNSVFMEYTKNSDGSFGKLPKRNVDFGGGLERITAASNNEADIFQTDGLSSMIHELESGASLKYMANPGTTFAYRIVADHMRAASFLAAAGVVPSNTDRGYFLRRLIRRSVLYADRIGLAHGSLGLLYKAVAAEYRDQYEELVDGYELLIYEEEDKFRETLERGMREFEKGTDAFTLFTTYGFPLEITKELAKERGIKIDEKDFKKKMMGHQELSRSRFEQKFKGGLADTAEKTVRLHTAHHLLLRALQMVLGPEVHQRGSNITQERLRIDFSHSQKLTDKQKEEIERIVNGKIKEGLPVIRSEMSREEARELGAEHEFGQKYPEMVSVYSIGPKNATPENPKFNERFSVEFCGGPHVSNTKELVEGGKCFRILKEEAVAAGIRRIKAVLI